MKKSFITLLISCLITGSMLVTGCNGKQRAQDQTSSDAIKKDSTQAMAYACPMHPEVTGKKGDTCSKCGMELEAVKAADSTTIPEAN